MKTILKLALLACGIFAGSSAFSAVNVASKGAGCVLGTAEWICAANLFCDMTKPPHGSVGGWGTCQAECRQTATYNKRENGKWKVSPVYSACPQGLRCVLAPDNKGTCQQ